MNPEDIDISADDRPMGGPPDPTPEPTTDEFDLFQGDFMSYSQLMSQMSLDLGAGTSGTQYCSARVIVRHSWFVHPSARDADTAGRKTRAPSP
jgi:hypothetical protein